MPTSWPSCSAPSCCPSLDRPPGRPRPAGLAGPPGRPGADSHRAQVPGACHPGRPRRPGRGTAAGLGRAGLGGGASPAGGVAGHRARLPGSNRCHRSTGHPARARPGHPNQVRPTSPGAASPARDRPNHRHDLGGRDRRHHSLPDRPQAVRLGRAHPDGAQLRPQGPPRPHHKMGSPLVRFVLQETAQRAKTRPPFASFYAPRPRRAAASTSPPWRSPASSSLAASMCSPTSKPLSERAQAAGCARSCRRALHSDPAHLDLSHHQTTDQLHLTGPTSWVW
jgi:hypothetical protein